MAAPFIESRKGSDPSLEIDVLDLFKDDLPDFNGDKAAAKMTFFGVGEMDANGQSAWDKIVEVTQRFSAADEYVFVVPMSMSVTPPGVK